MLRKLAGLFALAVAAFAQQPAKPSDATRLDPALSGTPGATQALVWHDIESWGVEGRAWGDQPRLRWFDRFPAAAEKTVPPKVWDLSRDSTGMVARFRTDATAISVRYRLLKEKLGFTNMSPMGVSGADLYARDANGRWRWVAAAKPDKQDVLGELIRDMAPGMHEFALYLPLYNGVEKFEIGVAPGATFAGLPPRDAKPVVFYGTSIIHGASATRPGMVHTAILGRRLDLPVINLGFSGNGKMDESVGAYLTQIDAAVYVIDCVPNMNAKLVAERCVPLVRQLRAARPDVPIVLVEDRRMTNDWILPGRSKAQDENHQALQAAMATLQASGMKGLYYIPGDHLFGDDGDGASDGSHPSDLGFMRQADVMEPVLRQALGRVP